jgi:hypothetical protein
MMIAAAHVLRAIRLTPTAGVTRRSGVSLPCIVLAEALQLIPGPGRIIPRKHGHDE